MKISRNTKETKIQLRLEESSDNTYISTGLPMLDHLLDQTFNYWGLPVYLEAEGDTAIDGHHTAEDIGYVIGCLIRQVEAKVNIEGNAITRFADLIQVMDDVTVWLAIDIGGRSHCDIRGFDHIQGLGGDLSGEMLTELIGAIAREGQLSIHAEWTRGNKNHHGAEALFKGLGRLIKQALTPDGKASTKGKVVWEVLP